MAVYKGQFDAGGTFFDALTDPQLRVQKQFPDVLEKVLRVDVSLNIPNEAIAFTKDFPADVGEKVIQAILDIAERYLPSAVQQADRTVLTRADLEADRIIKGHLTREFNEYGWLSEETKDDKKRIKCKRVWIVDPLDGTREFVMKNPEFVVSIALVEDGKPILGVIYNPYR